MDKNPFNSIKEHIRDQVLNYATMTDLTYHQRLLVYIKANPQLLRQSQSSLRLNQASALEESKTFESPSQEDH